MPAANGMSVDDVSSSTTGRVGRGAVVAANDQEVAAVDVLGAESLGAQAANMYMGETD